MSLKLVCWKCKGITTVEERKDNTYTCSHCNAENCIDFRAELKELFELKEEKP